MWHPTSPIFVASFYLTLCLYLILYDTYSVLLWYVTLFAITWFLTLFFLKKKFVTFTSTFSILLLSPRLSCRRTHCQITCKRLRWNSIVWKHHILVKKKSRKFRLGLLAWPTLKSYPSISEERESGCYPTWQKMIMLLDQAVCLVHHKMEWKCRKKIKIKIPN